VMGWKGLVRRPNNQQETATRNWVLTGGTLPLGPHLPQAARPRGIYNHGMWVRALVAVLALAGLADAFYFTFAYYGRIKKARWVPEILCAREGSSCVTVVQTPYARVFGVPNSLLGIFYYLLVVLWAAALPWISAIGWVLIAASAGAVMLGSYLIYSLRRKLYIDCPLCYAAHAINTVLLVLLILAKRS